MVADGRHRRMKDEFAGVGHKTRKERGLGRMTRKKTKLNE